MLKKQATRRLMMMVAVQEVSVSDGIAVREATAQHGRTTNHRVVAL
jgi:hypothetical protein